MKSLRLALLAVFGCFAVVSAFAAEDILIADFEGGDYGDWTVEGKAFGEGPAQGTLPHQMKVTGHRGKGLANSFNGGDGSTGTLTSPGFRIERKFVDFLIGGGGYEGTTCINLLVDGEVVRTATGPNTRPGGSEALRWKAWDVAEFMGKEARIQIVDQRSEGWGHINVDHIVQNDEPFAMEKTMELKVEKRYLNLPVENKAPKKWVRLMRGDEILREFDIELAVKEPDFWATLDLTPFEGETLTLQADDIERGTVGFDKITQADEIIGGEDLYQEKYRPQFHFSPKRGWNNDPNGMVYYAGEYHLFFQHNPYGWNWGNMTWGHAVSEDLVHWTELEDALHPDELGTIFSGSAVVDEANTTGFQTGDEKPLVCIYTYAGGRSPWSEGEPSTQGIAYSNDRGRTWTKYEGNPVQGHINGGNRDPKVFWHEASGQWVIVLYLDDHRMGFFSSPDLKSWKLESELECFHECPELFELPVDGNPNNMKWVLYGAAGDYFVGQFDGKEFKPDGESLAFNYGNCFYASQTFNNMPEEDGRRIQIAWGRAGHPDMPFNQMMDFPVELTLRNTEEGIRMFAVPVREIKKLHGEEFAWADLALGGKAPQKLEGPDGGLYDIRARIELGSAKEVELMVRGLAVTYDVEKGELRCKDKAAPLAAHGGVIQLQLLVDRLSLEIFANDGRVYMPMGHVFEDEEQDLTVRAAGGKAVAERLSVFELKSGWPH